MRYRRQPSGAFFRRLKAYSKPKPEQKYVVEPDSWIRKYYKSDAWIWTEVVAVVIGLAFIIPTAIALWIDLEDRQLQREALKIDLEDRQLQRIAQAWNSVTRIAPGNSGKGPALEYLNRQGIPLVGIDLSIKNNQIQSYLLGVSLPKANLNRANLLGADLREANLSEAFLTKINLSEALLHNSNLSGANLRWANLSEAKLYSANLTSVDLRDTNLSGVKLSGADLTGAILKNANLSGADLTKVNLSGFDLTNVNLSGTSLRGANLTGATLEGADLSNADLGSADFSGAYFRNSDLSGAGLGFANFRDARGLYQIDLDVACGNSETQLPEGLTIKACR